MGIKISGEKNTAKLIFSSLLMGHIARSSLRQHSFLILLLLGSTIQLKNGLHQITKVKNFYVRVQWHSSTV